MSALGSGIAKRIAVPLLFLCLARLFRLGRLRRRRVGLSHRVHAIEAATLDMEATAAGTRLVQRDDPSANGRVRCAPQRPKVTLSGFAARPFSVTAPFQLDRKSGMFLLG